MSVGGPKRDEATGKGTRLQNEQLYYFYSSPDIIRVIKSKRMRWPEYVACMGYRRGAYRFWMERPEGRRPLARPRRR
jgi:hypothetical protein